VQIAAVQQNGDALRYCHQPSEAVQLEAVKQNGDALRYCHQPSEAVQIAAVQKDGDALRYFKRAWIIEEIEREFGFEIEIVNSKGEK
jgi:hypothetical protein